MARPAAPLLAKTREYTPVSVATNLWPLRLLSNTLITATDALPGTHELTDLLFTDPAAAEPQNDPDNGFICWSPRPGSICEIWPLISDADGETVNALFGFAHPMVRETPTAGDPIQWKLTPMAVMVWTAGTKTGVAGGIVPETLFYADTITVSKALWPDPNPLRLVGPRTSATDGTLVPDNTPVGIQFDVMGGARPFLYLDIGTAAGVNILERSF